MDFAGLVKYFLKKIKNDNIGAYTGQATLFIVMSMIPFLLVILSFLRFTPVTEDLILQAIEIFVPGDVSPLLTSIIDEVYNNAGKVLVVALIVAIYSAAKAIQSLRYALNIVYDIDETRNWFWLRFRAMIDTFILIILITLLLLLVVFGQRIQDMFVANHLMIVDWTALILKYRMVIIFFFLIIFFAVIYRILPNRKATFRSQLVGAVGCSIAWYIFTFFVAIYIDFFNGFSFYGSLTMLVILMFWLYIAIYIFLVCGEVNSRLEVVLKEYKLTKQLKKEREQNREINVFRIDPYTMKDINPMAAIWNERAEGGQAIAMGYDLTINTAGDFFASMDYVGAAKIDDEVVGFYIVRKNNEGYCDHQANVSYAIAPSYRGKQLGERLMRDALRKCKELDYELLICNTISKNDEESIRMYHKLGFRQVGQIPDGYILEDGTYTDVYIFYQKL